jgi:hypothetical protein
LNFSERGGKFSGFHCIVKQALGKIKKDKPRLFLMSVVVNEEIRKRGNNKGRQRDRETERH